MAVDVEIRDLPELHALVIRRRVPHGAVGDLLAESLPAVYAHAQAHGLEMSGPPFARYLAVEPEHFLVEAGIPLAEAAPGEPDAGIEPIVIPAGPAAVAVHEGPYERLKETYEAGEAWLAEEGRTASGPPWESYLTDPGDHPDPETWRTEVVQPVEP